MNRAMLQAAIGLVLMALPVIAVTLFKQTHWAPILVTPLERQTGDPHASVVIVEYSDFQCPSCAAMQPIVHNFLDYYKGRIRLAYKYFPLTKIHKNAMASAQAAECAARQHKFWPYQDRLFATQTAWAPLADPTTSFMAIAAEVQLNAVQFKACYSDPAAQAPIQADMREGEERQVNATPTFFVDEERLVGHVFADEGAGVIDRHLRR